MVKKKPIAHEKTINKNDQKKPRLYAGSEEKLLNLVVDMVVKIIVKEIL